MGVPPSAKPNNLGVVGGDTAGFPNGRRLADDITDIAVKAVAGAAYSLFHPEFTPYPLAYQLAAGVDARDAAFRLAFPCLALPLSGVRYVPHGLRSQLRRRLFPDFVRHRDGAVSERREDLQEPLSGYRGQPVRRS